jgi:hypothetical protein
MSKTVMQTTGLEIGLPYVVAIPTYKRPVILLMKTLRTLYRDRIDPKLIYIFLANQEQLVEYKNLYNDPLAIDKYNIPRGYKAYIQKPVLVVGFKGLRNQRNFIADYFPPGQCILHMDDDIDSIQELNTQQQTAITQSTRRRYTLQPIANLDKFIQAAFEQCSRIGAHLWGIYPVANPYFMTPQITTGLKFIVGPMYGTINRHSQDLRLTTDEKENVERTLQYYTKDNAVIRYNNVTVVTNYFTTPGGMQASLSRARSTRKDAALSAANYLHGKYPALTTVFTGKKSGWPELKLRNLKGQIWSAANGAEKKTKKLRGYRGVPIYRTPHFHYESPNSVHL